MNRESDLKVLVGKTPARLWVDDGEGTLLISCIEGTLRCVTYGDCCSETWFADAIGVKQFLRGAVVTDVAILDMPDYNVEDGRTRQEYDRAYGFRVRTDQGAVTFVYRNSSNGYYGGDCSFYWDAGDHLLPNGFRAIEEDWSA